MEYKDVKDKANKVLFVILDKIEKGEATTEEMRLLPMIASIASDSIHLSR